jgi:SAM-dependent methyltransferase
MTKGLGQYDLEYRECSCFWGTEPSKYVRMLPQKLATGRVLDLGAGEGKNAIFLGSRGFEVVAVECSDYALTNFRARLRELKDGGGERLRIVQADVNKYLPEGEFDVVIAYGLLHCLSSVIAVHDVVRMMQGCTRLGGLNVVATFTSVLPVPDVHGYLEPTLLRQGELETLYARWEILSCENGIIEETHPTTEVLHKHSICRLMARKNGGDRQD